VEKAVRPVEKESWKSVLSADATSWLLEADDPSVRYYALKDLLGKPNDHAELIEAKTRIMSEGIVPRILAKQKEGGYWGKPENFYIRSKYKGTVWQLIVLAELGADGEDNRVRKACEFILENSQDRESGGFAHYSSKNGGGDHNKILPCLTGNMVWSLIRSGYLDDQRVKHAVGWITEYQRFDDGEGKAPKGWPYDKKKMCFGRHTCHMGAVKALKALSEIPQQNRGVEVNNTIEKGAEYLLVHHIFKRSHYLSQISKSEWLQFGFPSMADTNVLEILDILSRLGYNDERMKEAVDLVVSKQDSQGRWKLDTTFNGRMQVNIEEKDKPSKWITLKALTVLKRLLGKGK